LKTFQVTAPSEFLSAVTGNVNKRNGVILNSETNQGWFNLQCEVALNDMFGYCKRPFQVEIILKFKYRVLTF
jgi:translation elongation factor EF-G